MIKIKTTIFLILWVAVIVAGILLGQWQLDRLSWKNRWLANIDAAYRQPNFIWPDQPIDQTFFRRGLVDLVFEPDQIFIVRPRLHQGQMGGYLFQRGRVKSLDRSVWVNRGFVPDDFVVPVTGLTGQGRFMAQLIPADFSGVAKVGDHQKSFTPDLLHVSDETKLPKGVERLVLVPEATSVVPGSDLDSSFPRAVGTRPMLNNNHLSYAIFWFGMAGIAFLFGIFLSIRSLLLQNRRR